MMERGSRDGHCLKTRHKGRSKGSVPCQSNAWGFRRILKVRHEACGPPTVVRAVSSKREDISFIPGREPVVRIGVVLARDGKTQIDAETLQDGYAIAVGPDEAPQANIASGPINIQASEGRLRVVAKAFDRSGYRSLRMVPPFVGASGCPDAAVLVRGVVAGRGFHWCIKIDQRLGGVLEFRADGSNLILINELPLEEYLVGVITAEMSGYCPGEYIKAHAVISRSWLLASSRSNHPGEPFTWCNDDCCQRYQGNGGWTRSAIDALAATRGQVLIAATGEICRTSFCKNSGGITEDPVSAWRAASPGLRARFEQVPPMHLKLRFFPLDAADMSDYHRNNGWRPRVSMPVPQWCRQISSRVF